MPTDGAEAGINAYGNLVTSGGTITFNGLTGGSSQTAIALNGSLTFDTTGGGTVASGADVIVNSTVDNYPGFVQSLAITAGSAGHVMLGGTVGGLAPVTTFSVTGGSLAALSGITTTGTQAYNLVNSASFAGSLNGQSVSVTAPTITLASATTTSGQVYRGNLTLNGSLSDPSFVEIGGNLQLGATPVSMSVNGTIDGGGIVVGGAISSAGPATLNVSAGQGLFAENGTLPTASFTSGNATINLLSTGNTQTQTLSGTVDASTINPNDHLLLTGASPVTIINGSGAAIVTASIDDAPGQTTGLIIQQTAGGNGVSLGTVGGAFALSSLSFATPAGEGVSIAGGIGSSVAAGVSGATTLSTANVTSSSTQNYGGAVTLLGNTTIASTAGNVVFGGTVDSDTASGISNNRNLTVIANTGSASFGGAVGGTATLGTLTVEAGGIGLNAVTTAGGQYYLPTASTHMLLLGGNLTTTTASDIRIQGYATLLQPQITLKTSGTISTGDIVIASGVFSSGSTLNFDANLGLAVVDASSFGGLLTSDNFENNTVLHLVSSGNNLTSNISGTVTAATLTNAANSGKHLLMTGNVTISDATSAVNVTQSIDSAFGQSHTLTVTMTGTGTGVSFGGSVGELTGIDGSAITNVLVSASTTSGTPTVTLNGIGTSVSTGNSGTLTIDAATGKTLTANLSGTFNSGNTASLAARRAAPAQSRSTLMGRPRSIRRILAKARIALYRSPERSTARSR